MSSAPGTERVVIADHEYRVVHEGLASVLAPYRVLPPGASEGRPKNNDEGDQAVFYNPIQQFNRDLSVLAILIYGEGAMLEKEEGYKKKKRSGKKSRGNAERQKGTNPLAEADNAASTTNAFANGTPKKRKLSETDQQNTMDESNTVTKKPRTDDSWIDENDLEALVGESAGSLNAEETNTSTKFITGFTNAHSASSAGDRRPSKGQMPSDHSQVSFTILDALSATGLRALRYAKEIPFATRIIANDLSSEAVKSIELNVKHNDVQNKVSSSVSDARALLYSKVGNEHKPAPGKQIHRFDVIDLDPYGTAAPFLDAAVQALQDGGLLCVTCTDAGVFASNGYPEKAYALYGGTPVKGAHSHEGGLRLILHAVATSAAKYSIAVEPLLSLSIDFYARLFIRVHKQQKDVKLLAGTTMVVYNCDHGCGAWTTQLIAKNQAKEDKKGDGFFKHGFAQAPSVGPDCQHCGFKMHLGGPMWAGPLHNPYFIQKMLDRLPTLDQATYQTVDRLQGMLTVALEEDLTLAASNTPRRSGTSANRDMAEPETSTLANQPSFDTPVIPRLPPDTIDRTPLFFIPSYLAKVLHAVTPAEDQLRGAIRHLGYQVTRSHCKAGSFKTDAPWHVIWEIMREWVRKERPIKADAIKPGTAGWAIMERARGTKRAKLKEIQEDLVKKIGKCEDLKALEVVLQAGLYSIGRDALAEADSDRKQEHQESNGEQPDVSHSVGAKTIVFDEKLGQEKPRAKLVRYQLNPRADWGPMSRARVSNAGLLSAPSR